MVRKMLILNAGHKTVSTQHQFEILFLSLWKSIDKKVNNVKIIREKKLSLILSKRRKKPVNIFFHP